MAAAKRVKRPTEVEGVTMKMVVKEVFEEAWSKALAECEQMDDAPIDLSKSKKILHERVKNLVLWYRATAPNTELCRCTECGGDSDVRLECCPFCGDADVADDSEVADIAEAPEEEAPEEEAPEEEAPEEEAPEEEEPEEEEPEEEAPEEEAPEVEVVDPEEEPGDTGGTELALSVAPNLTATDLANAMIQFEKYKKDAAESLWKLGRIVKHILDTNLWMLAEDDNGNRKYRTFKQFVASEMAISYRHAHRLMQVSEAFSESEMKQVGVAKCQLLLQVPKDKRDGMLETTKKENPTRAQLSDAVKEMTQKERPQPPNKNQKRLTAVMAPGRTELKLYARPKGREGYPSAEEAREKMRRAQNIGDDPFAMEVLPNDVRVLYHLARDTDGSMLLIIERKRAKEDEVFSASEMNAEPEDD